VWRVEKNFGDPVRKGEVLALIDSAEVGKAKGDFLQSLTVNQIRAANWERMKAAAKSGAISDRSLADAEGSLREARIKLLSDQQALLNLGLAIRLADVEKLP
jgi:membrane fusion protein, heavy metal efflux system